MMKRNSLCCYVLAVAAGSSATTGQAGEKALTREAMHALQASAPRASFYEVGPRVTRVYGQALSTGTSPKASAEQFRLGHARVFGVAADELRIIGRGKGSVAEQLLMFDRNTGTYKFTLFTYAQEREGIPVFRSNLSLLVRNEPGFPVVLAVSSARDLGVFVPEPVSLMFDAAEHTVTGMESFSEQETVIWAGIGDEVAAPLVAVTFIGEKGSPQGGNHEKYRYVADATTGEILLKEDMIIYEDVFGNASALASEGPKPDFCTAEAPTPMPYARASIPGSGAACADAYGDFVIPHLGVAPVTVESPVIGEYFLVTDRTGEPDFLTQTVTPPGPADFLHNAANDNEYTRSQANAYIQANVVRDFILTYNPDYPTISTQRFFPVNVNVLHPACPGNAYYNFVSINFCPSGGGHPNMAWSTVVHHEYGHHAVTCSEISGQGQYGEGMGDCLGMLILDDPGLGYGYNGDCNTPIRTAVNTLQYPCEDEIHFCGQLLSGCIWDIRNELAITNPDTYLDILSNLTVNSILLHIGELITPQITIDFLTLDDDDANIGNGTPHWSEICLGFGAHNMDCPPLDVGLSVSPDSDFEPSGPIGGPITPMSKVFTLSNLSGYAIDYSVTKSAPWSSLSNATGTIPPSATADVTLTLDPSVNNFPYGKYTDTLTFVNTTDHLGDTTRDVSLSVGELTLAHEWTLDTDPGWTTEDLWAWGQPTGEGGVEGGSPDPTSGYTGVNVYGFNLYGDYANGDSGALTTLPIDCTDVWDTRVMFWRWLGIGAGFQYDIAAVEVSNDGVNWTRLWDNGLYPHTDDEWVLCEYNISDVADNQPTVYLRWDLESGLGSGYCGWNIDDIRIIGLGGESTCSDFVKNQGEDRIDCGGPCPPCACVSDVECGDSAFCNGIEICDAWGQCGPGPDPCPGLYCDEFSDLCYQCDTDLDCDDGAFCNGEEICAAGFCQGGSDPCPTLPCDETYDVCTACNENLTCEQGEDCHTCPSDCIGSSGAVCGNNVCETADGEDCVSCADDCNGVLGGKPSGRYCCGDGTAQYGVTCSDPLCTGGGNTCTTVPAEGQCCGDGVCEGAENDVNCSVDCGCILPSDCDDANECTTDDCVCGACQNTPVADQTLCAGGICCGGSCAPAACSVDGDCEDGDECTTDTCNDGGTCAAYCDNIPVVDETPCAGGVCCSGVCSGLTCSVDGDCDDAETCTTDTCYNGGTCAAYCDNVWASCGIEDGCCGPACTPADDSDCACLARGEPCSANDQCCSDRCLKGACK
ncbi:MAG: hypothetical protein JSU63_21030 [Phycisphaerales bacterium]|nr:MAG: hypothetical protein JSU63_21030 [Phycisphaerales bacterium]